MEKNDRQQPGPAPQVAQRQREALWWRQKQQMRWIFYTSLHGEMAERHHDTSRPCSSESSLSLAGPPTWGEGDGETKSGGNKSRNCFEGASPEKANTEEVVSVFMVLWKIEVSAVGSCFDGSWVMEFWWMSSVRTVRGAGTSDSTAMISDHQKLPHLQSHV